MVRGSFDVFLYIFSYDAYNVNVINNNLNQFKEEHKMKKAELNKIFTAKVNELLAQGYIFYTQTMAGHQGEIAKVDLTNGEEVIRVVMENGPTWDKEKNLFLNDNITITVGRATKVTPGTFSSTIWNNDLEVIDQEIFYQAGYHSDYLITKEEAIENAKKHKERLMKAAQPKETEEITDKDTIKVLLPYINKLEGCKSVKARHITGIEKQVNTNGSFVYHITIQKKDKTKVELLNSKTLKIMRGAC